ncbi:Alanyl-tRNA editing protein Aarsd1 [Pleodorina starrii]|uniref:Alanyl-tRNA editing protein Aarsd1 n=1 Tax=Pleodorina starrii TaxID=330485 RepID=A0A9W6BQW7_9CHLO|nr:Alanyl-tRNA editing protein Aarsd1 [Pleodorina starrii]GLC56771.1 Alanyl-tRNA editing protein Aarsd1 [Pleodorina starrii]GLC66927.1 Alanyl-tRNA editing protein Aarsd1 [Pleodorina starrii]
MEMQGLNPQRPPEPVTASGGPFSEIQPLLQQPGGAVAAPPAGPGFGHPTPTIPGPSDPAAAGYWARMKARAQRQIASLREKAVEARRLELRSAGENLSAVKVAAQEVVAERTSWVERGRRAWALVQLLDSGPLAKWAARAMVCAFYVNQVAEAMELWVHLRNAPIRRRWADEPPPRPPAFPVLMVAVLLPCALLCACGLLVPLTGGALLASTLYEDARLTWRQILSIVRYGSRPTELLAKRLAMIGAALLVVAHSARDRAKMRSYAGMLLAADDRTARTPGRHKSAALLAGRLLLACLLLFAGINQMRRVLARGGALWQAVALTPRQQAAAAAALEATYAAAGGGGGGGGLRSGGLRPAGGPSPVATAVEAAMTAAGAAAAGAAAAGAPLEGVLAVAGTAGAAAAAGGGAAAVMGGGPGAGAAAPRHHYGVPDSHDNNWQLLQMVLCLPLALGWMTGLTCRALAAVLLLEALTCWPWWAWYWPSWHYAAHVRLHFFTNVAVAGGLVLLQCLGAGRFTVDSLLGRKTD